MTNGLAQNIENNTENILNSALLANNTTNLNFQTKEAQSIDFSNLMNSVNAKTQQMQTKFVDRAVKSNTSSINKLALNSKNQNKQALQNVHKNSSNQITQDKVENLNQKTKQQSEVFENTSVVANKTVSKNDKQESVNKIDTKDAHTVSASKIEKNDKNNLSDINNSSFVESSPVFSSKTSEQEVQTNEKQETQIEPTLLAITQDINLEQFQELKDKIDEILSEVGDSSELLKAIEDISNLTNNSDDLSQDFKNQLNEIIDSIKEKASSLESVEVEIDFKNLVDKLLSDIKTKIDEKLTSLEENPIEISNDTLQDDKLELKLEAKVEQKIEDTLVELKNKLSELKENNSQNLDKILDNIDENLSKIEENIEISPELKEKISQVVDEVEKLLNDSKKSLEVVKVESDNDLLEKLSKINNDLKELFNEKNISNSDLQLEKQPLSNEVSELLNIDVDKLSKIEKSDKKTMNEILDILSSVEQESDIQDEKINEDVKNLIEEISQKQAENLQKPNEFAEKLQTLQTEVKQYFNEEDEEVELKDNNSQLEIISSENEIELSEIFKNQTSSNEFSEQKESVKQANFDNKDAENVEDFDLNVEIDNDIQIENKIKTSDNKNIDVKNLEENLKKSLHTQKILDEILVDSKVSTISSQSGALSVADEVAKLAMEEINPLSSNSNLQGSVLYDSASGQGALIKNAAQLLRTAQGTQNFQNVQNPNLDFSTNDILNQITEKLQQLKNGAEQKLTMVLRPNDLGRLSIELTSSKVGLTTNIMAQNEDVRAYIEKNIDMLRQQLSDAGINVNNIQIKTAGQEGSTNYDGNHNFNQQHENKEDLNQQNNKQQHNKENNKDRQQMFANMSNYDLHFAKDFSSILNKSISYNLN